MKDDPIIRDLERNGVPYRKTPVCPVCGEECEKIYKDVWGNILGCDNCVEEMDAEEALEDEDL